VTVEKSGSHPGVGNDRNGAQLLPHGATCVAELETTFFGLAVPTPGCTTTATYVASFFQANFELHQYDVEK
jgi:hypothetical protein